MTTYATLALALMSEPGFNGLNDSDALSYGNASVVVSTDHTPYTWSGIGQKLIANGAQPSDVINMATNITTLPGGPLLNACLNSGGFDFADPTNRALIQSFEVSEPDWAVSVLNAMLAIGITMGTRWQIWGLTQPVLGDITNARSYNANYSIITNFMNHYWLPLINSGFATVAQLQALASDNTKWT